MRAGEAEKSIAKKKGKTVQVLYTFFDKRLTEQGWKRYFCNLPKETQTKVMRYRRWEDRQAGVFGKLLLMEALKGYGYTANALSKVCVDDYGRPLIDYFVDPSTAIRPRPSISLGAVRLSSGYGSTLSMHRAPVRRSPAKSGTEGGEAGGRRRVDFNISHSGECVVCAVSKGTRVGIDIEKRKALCLSDLADCLSAGEKEELMKSENRTARFYDFWTMKESLLKADGRGLSVPMVQIIIEDGRARLNGATWFLTELDFGPDYSCHLATDIEPPAIEVEKVEFH